MNNFNYCTDANDTISFTTDAGADLLFSGITDDLTGWPRGTMLEWLPEACKWKKYWPIWHLKVSYNSA